MASEADLPYSLCNGLNFAYCSLRSKERLLEGSLQSPYEEFFSRVAVALSPHTSSEPLPISLSEVEAFYTGQTTRAEFVSTSHARIKALLAASPSQPQRVSHMALGPLNSVIWDLYATESAHAHYCTQVPSLVGRMLWEMFIKLDTESARKVHIDDLAMVIARIFEVNSHQVKAENIKEWFCGETYIDFWSFFTSLIEKYSMLLQPSVVQDLYDTIILEVLHKGKMMKKGHQFKTWKERWFVLTVSSITYFESQENQVQKGSICINANTEVSEMVATKGHPFRFKVTDGAKRTEYEMSATTDQDRKKWLESIRIATQAHKVEGRNLIHRLHLSREIICGTRSTTTPVPPQTASSGHKPLSLALSAPISQRLVAPPTKEKPAKRFVQARSQDDPSIVMRKLADVPSRDIPPRPHSQADSMVDSPQHRILRVEEETDGRPDAHLRRRHSSNFEETGVLAGVEHINENGHDYAVVNVAQKKTSSVDAPVAPVAAPRQLKMSITDTDSQQRSEGTYVQAYFVDNTASKPPSHSPILEHAQRPKDISHTRFAYSQVNFSPPQQDKGLATDLKKTKTPPALPSKYEGASPVKAEAAPQQAPIPKKRNLLPQTKSDSEVVVAGNATRSLSKQQQSVPNLQPDLEGSGDYDNMPADAPPQAPSRAKPPQNGGTEQYPSRGGYVNVELPSVPKIPPRRGKIVSPTQEEQPPPPVPMRRT